MMIVLVGIAALTIDLGYVYVLHGNMQNAVDASALAGASGANQGEAAAVARAVSVASGNQVGDRALSVAEMNIQVGHWRWTDQAFTPANPDDPISSNAVRVLGGRGEIPLFFALSFGQSDTAVSKAATALAGSGRCVGLWGLEGVLVNGDVYTDSYDSSLGAYGPGNVNPNGDLCSCRDVDVAGSIEIHGDAMYGPDYAFVPHGSVYEVWGLIGDHPCRVETPPFDMPYAKAHNDNDTIGLTDAGRSPYQGPPGSVFLIEDDNLTLLPGVYYFRSVRITGQATLTITGPTEIYVEHNMELNGGGLVNLTEDPAALTIYCTGTLVELGGTSAFYGAVVAPDATLKLSGTNDYYGTLLGRVLDLNGNARIHVDESIVQALYGLDAVAPILVE